VEGGEQFKPGGWLRVGSTHRLLLNEAKETMQPVYETYLRKTTTQESNLPPCLHTPQILCSIDVGMSENTNNCALTESKVVTDGDSEGGPDEPEGHWEK